MISGGLSSLGLVREMVFDFGTYGVEIPPTRRHSEAFIIWL